MLELLPAIREHFDHLEERLWRFKDLEIQVEGWLKAEFLFALLGLKRRGILEDLDREVRIDGKRIDVKVTYDGNDHYVELKHCLIGLQRDFKYTSSFYFTDRSSVGIVQDVDKLRMVPGNPARWLFLLHTGNPGIEQWEEGLNKFNAKFAPRTLIAHSWPDQFPDTYFLGLLQVEADGTVGNLVSN